MRKRKTNIFAIFISRKIVFLLITYSIFLVIIFLVPCIIPSNMLTMLLAKLYRQAQTSPELIGESYRHLMKELGMGRPLWEQYLNFICRTFTRDLDTSISLYLCKVAEVIAMNLSWSLGLLITTFLIFMDYRQLNGSLDCV